MRQAHNGFGRDFGLVGKNVRHYLATTALTATSFLALVSPALADNWTDHTGTGITVDTSIPNTTNITQSLDIVKVSGDGDINAGWTVNVAQPSSSSKYVLYDIEGDPVNIMGNLNANGQIYIFDQNGVIFGAGSQVNVGSIIASTGMISDANLADNKLVFENVGTTGQIINNGKITVADAGIAAFVAPTVINNGEIVARMGSVVLAAGEKVTLDMYGDNLIEVALEGALSDALIENKGSIQASGGNVVITAAAAKDAVDNVINMDGIVDVSSVSVKGGKIILGGGSKGTVKVAGKLDASGTTGGDVKVTGENLDFTNTAEITNNGDDANTYIYGTNKAIFRSRMRSIGNNTFAEISGNSVSIGGSDIGVTGGLLIDPPDYVIDAIEASAIVGQLSFGNTSVMATNWLSVDSEINSSAQTNNSVLRILDQDSNADLRVDLKAKIILGVNQSLQGEATKINVSSTGSVQNAVDVSSATNGSLIKVAPGTYVETAKNRTLPWASGATYNMGLFVDKDNITIRGVDALGNVITDPNNVLATIEAGDITNFGAMHGVVGNGVTFAGLKFTPKVGVRNKTIEVWGNNFTLRNSVVDNSNSATNPTGFNGIYENYGAGAVYIGDERFNTGTNTSFIQRFNLNNNVFIAGSVAITNGVGVLNNLTSSPSGRTITNNTFIGNSMDPSRADVIYNSGILLTGRQPTIAWRQNPIGLVNISGNSFEGTSLHILARGEIRGALNWENIFNDNTFDKSAAAFETPTLVRGEDYVVNGDPRSDWRAVYNKIQWAVDGAETNNTVRVGAGTYLESVNVGKSISLMGANAGLAGYDPLRGDESIIDPNSPGFAVTANNVTIDGFEITGADTGVLVSGASGVRVLNNNIHDVLESGVSFTNSASGEVSNNLIHDTVNEGILASLSNNLQTLGNLIYNTGKDGIAVLNSANTRIANNVIGFTDFAGTIEGDENNVNGDGIYAYNADGADEGTTLITGNKITQTHSTVDGKGSGINVVNSQYVFVGGYSPEEENIVTNARWDGIRTDTKDGGVSQVITIAGNTVDQIGRVGIYAANTSSLLINDNDVTNTTSQIGSPYGGISTDWGSFITVTGNNVSGSGQGVRMYNASGMNLITGNDINAVTDNGIHVYDMLGGSSAEVSGNYIGLGDDRVFGTEDDTKIGAHGIYALNTQSLNASNNFIGNTGAQGIWVENSNTVDLNGNFIDNTGKDAIRLTKTTGVTNVSGNQIGQNSLINGNGILLIEADGTTNSVKLQRNVISNTLGDDSNGINVYMSMNVLIGGESSDDANIIRNTAWDGIKVDKGGSNKIKWNDVANTTRVGIYAGRTEGVEILHNTVHDSDIVYNGGFGAITVTESSFFDVSHNIVTGGEDSLSGFGIWVGANTGENTIFDNDASDINGTGIYAENISELSINQNRVYNTHDGHGIHAVNITNGLEVNHNIIGGRGFENRIHGNGIFVEDTFLMSEGGPRGFIQGNDVRNTRSEDRNNSNGIFVKNSEGFLIGGIDIEPPCEVGGDEEDQIEVSARLQSGLSLANIVRNTGWDGIRVQGGGYHTVVGNDVRNTERAGIFAKNVRGISILGNRIVDANWTTRGALSVKGGRNVIVADNRIVSREDSRAGSGIYMLGTKGFTLIAGNRISGINSFGNGPGHGIYVDAVKRPRIFDNRVRDVEGDGIYVSGATTARIRGNTVTGADFAGLHLAGPSNGYANISGNTFRDNDIGAFFESGLIDLTHARNRFIGGRIGIRFAPYSFVDDGNGDGEGGGDYEGPIEDLPRFAKLSSAYLSLVDDDGIGSDPYVPGTVPTNYGGTLGKQLFKDQSEYYVELDNGAFYQPGMPTVLNATHSKFIDTDAGYEIKPDEFPGLILPADQIAFLESMFYHYPDGQAAEDFQNLGIFFFGNAAASEGSGPDIDQRLIFSRFPSFNGDLTGLNVQIRGLPNLPGQGGGNSPSNFNNIETFGGDPADLNNIETAAGGGDDLNDIEPAAGGEDQSCWNSAANAAGQGQVVNVVYQGSFTDNMEETSSCGTAQ